MNDANIQQSDQTQKPIAIDMPQDTVTIPKAEYEKLKREQAEYLDGWKRAKADYINFKRETEQRQDEWLQFASLTAIMGLLPIYNHFKSAFDHVSDDIKAHPWTHGMKQILQEMKNYLSSAGVEEVPTVGVAFDPDRHESVGSERHLDKALNVIVKEVSPGYTMHGKVIVPAKVIINSTESIVQQPQTISQDQNQDQRFNSNVKSQNSNPPLKS